MKSRRKRRKEGSLLHHMMNIHCRKCLCDGDRDG